MSEINFTIQKSPLCVEWALTVIGDSLSSQAVSSQVLSAYVSLTAVFGMGTGGTSQPSSPNYPFGVGQREESLHPQNCIREELRKYSG